jgi:hypothetical protein
VELLTARMSTGLVCWYRPANLSALEPVQVRILSTSETLVIITPVLAGPVPVSETLIAAPEDLHFEADAFEVQDTEPSPPPSAA